MADDRRATTQPLPVMGVVRHGLSLYAQNAGALWRILLPLALAAQLVSVALTVSLVPAGSIVSGGTIYVPPGSALGNVAIAGTLGTVFEALVGVLAFGATIRLLATTALGQPEQPADALRYAFRRIGPLLWLSIMYGVLVAFGGLLLFVPGIYMAAAFAVSTPVLVIEGLRGGAALKRSRQLTKGRWWPTLGALALTGVTTAVVAIVVTLMLRVSGSVTAYALAQAASGLLIQVFLVPFSIATIVAIYIDLRNRREPEQLNCAFGADRPSSPPTPITDPWA